MPEAGLCKSCVTKEFGSEKISIDGRSVRVASGYIANFQEGEGGPSKDDEMFSAAHHFKRVEKESLELD